MIKVECVSCGEHQIVGGPKQLQSIVECMQIAGPHTEVHMVLRTSCCGLRTMQEIEDPGWRLQNMVEKMQERLSGVEMLSDLFPEGKE